MSTNHTLIYSLRHREESAYRELFDTFFAPLHQLAALYVQDHDVANDIVQEVFIAIYEHTHLLQNVDNLEGYLRIAVRNRCLNYLRSLDLEDRGKRLYYEELIETEYTNSPEMNEMIQTVRSVLKTLPDACRQICELRFVEGMKIKEIALHLSLSENTVKVQLHRGMNKVREACIKEAGSNERKQKAGDILLMIFLL